MGARENRKLNVALLKALNQGLLPPHYFAAQAKRSLKAYVEDYLAQEIMTEGRARNPIA